MAKMIFVNLPVANLERSIKFYDALGFVKNEQFSNDLAAGMVWSEEIWVMLLTHDFYKKFTAGRAIPDTQSTAQVLNCLSFENTAEVDKFVAAAVANGGSLLPEVVIEGSEGMYGRDITDPDGHIWEALWMEMPE
jgi:predicted lactoylglutathione lyase